ncbi:PREDICTED: uncharacterized protein LOC104590014 [Nelumbo nucifera]|uniref:Uncharacterized protein LOC104590014 n=1 Tax=Nelumbo nucifera TaxID=4432 RepID=A0A1U8PZJ9_NELNU|nr:PREDICTED: uncharacterized protein LOC104590014 [Nelumbo nucifera]
MADKVEKSSKKKHSKVHKHIRNVIISMAVCILECRSSFTDGRLKEEEEIGKENIEMDRRIKRLDKVGKEIRKEGKEVNRVRILHFCFLQFSFLPVLSAQCPRFYISKRFRFRTLRSRNRSLMEKSEEIEAARKRMKPVEEKDGDAAAIEEETTTNLTGSEEMELNIARLLERIERFTEQVTELLEAGKTMFKELSNEFEERMIAIHREQIEKWQEEIKDLRLVDASNEEVITLLNNARFLLQNFHADQCR